MTNYLPSTIIPLVDQLWLPLSETSTSFANSDLLSVDTKGLQSPQLVEAIQKNWTQWKNDTFKEDVTIMLFLYNLRFNNVSLKQSLQQWIYPIVDSTYQMEEDEAKPDAAVVTWEERNTYTNKMCQMYQKDMIDFVCDKTCKTQLQTENVDITPADDLFTSEELRMRRVVCIPLYYPREKKLYFIHTSHSSFQYEIAQQ